MCTEDGRVVMAATSRTDFFISHTQVRPGPRARSLRLRMGTPNTAHPLTLLLFRPLQFMVAISMRTRVNCPFRLCGWCKPRVYGVKKVRARSTLGVCSDLAACVDVFLLCGVWSVNPWCKVFVCPASSLCAPLQDAS